ncbi:MAG: rRNA pseudouridine synthase [Simkania negevensis]|nr:rRNA pseudouridine synthase [Simkania negevensis]
MIKKRLSKALAAAGIASRRKAEELIVAGQVEVNGEVIKIPQTLVSWEEDRIRVAGELVTGEQGKVYFLLNKPKGYLCTNQLESGKRVVDLFSEIGKRLFTAGRLDKDTTGLIIVTNDGAFAQKVIHPSSNLSKEYLVKTVEEISHEALVQISKGMRLEGEWIAPVRVVKVRRNTLKVVVKEGKKREVRALVGEAGLEIISLTRIRIGGILLGDLKEGAWRELREEERNAIFA